MYVIEAAMTKMERKINFLMKVVEEWDHEIVALKYQMQAWETTGLRKTSSKANKKRKTLKLCCRKTSCNNPPLLSLYRFNSCKTWSQTPSKPSMKACRRLLLCTPSRTRRESTTLECLLDTNTWSSNSLMEKATQSNALRTLLKHARMQEPEENSWSSNFSRAWKETLLIGTLI